jgi:hypothetical protein
MDRKCIWTPRHLALIRYFFFNGYGITFSRESRQGNGPYSWWSCFSLKCIWGAGASWLTSYYYTLLTKSHNSGSSATRPEFLQSPFFLWRYSPNLGLGLPPWNSPFHFGFLDLRESVVLLGRVISSSQTQTQKNAHIHTNIKHPCHEWDSNPRSRLPSERPLGYRDRLSSLRSY